MTADKGGFNFISYLRRQAEAICLSKYGRFQGWLKGMNFLQEDMWTSER